MPPNEECPSCQQVVFDWHLEWHPEGPATYKRQVAMDCPLCGKPIGFEKGRIGSAPPGVPLVRRNADKAAQWAAFQAVTAGGTLQGCISAVGAGWQYAGYWASQEAGLKPEEAAKYKAVREQVAGERPDLVARHHQRMANLDELQALLDRLKPVRRHGF